MPRSDVQTGYAPVNGLQMYYEIHGAGAPLRAAARRVHDDRRDGAAPARPGRAPAGDRRRAAGPRAHRRHRPPDHLRADGRRHGRAAPASRRSARPTSSASAWARHRPAAGDPPPGPGAQAGGRLGLVHQRRHARRGARDDPDRSRPRCSPARRWRRSTSGSRRTRTTSRSWSRSSKQLDSTPFAWPRRTSAGSRRRH